VHFRHRPRISSDPTATPATAQITPTTVSRRAAESRLIRALLDLWEEFRKPDLQAEPWARLRHSKPYACDAIPRGRTERKEFYCIGPSRIGMRDDRITALPLGDISKEVGSFYIPTAFVDMFRAITNSRQQIAKAAARACLVSLGIVLSRRKSAWPS
jgi:hypothetical protein